MARISRAVSFLWAVSLVAACGGEQAGRGAGPGAAGTPASGGTLIFARGTDSKSLDPAVVTDGESVKVITNVFDTLVAFRPGTAELQPGLAKSWTSSPDGLTWTFDLRDATFHDGTKVDAESVVFSFLRQRDASHPAHTEECPYWQDSFGMVSDVRATGPGTVEVKLSAPFAPFEAAMALFSMSIVSPAGFSLEGTDAATGKFKRRFGENPVGSGPYKFARWNRDDTITLERFDGWWGWNGAAQKAPAKIVFKTIKDNTQRLLAVEGGQADVMDGLNPQDQQRVAKSPALALVTQPGLNIAYFAMNTRKKPFDDPRVRRAVAAAISKETIRRAAYDGAGEIACTPIPRSMPGWKEIPAAARDVDRAKSLLAEAGLAQGFSFKLAVMDNPRPYMPRPKDVAIQIQQDLAAAGIRAEIDVLDFKRLLDDAQNGRHDACLLGWSADYGDPDNFLYVLLSKETARVGSSQNVAFYTDDTVSAWLDEARRVSDRAKRMELYAKAQDKIAADVPLMPLVTMPELRVVSRRVSGYLIYPAGGEFLHGVRIQ